MIIDIIFVFVLHNKVNLDEIIELFFNFRDVRSQQAIRTEKNVSAKRKVLAFVHLKQDPLGVKMYIKLS